MAVAMLVATLASLTLLTVGLMGLLGRLPRNHFAGIRTRATLASDEAWQEAHRIGSAPVIFAAVAALAIGLALLPFVLAGAVGDRLALAILIVQVVLLAGGAVASGIVAQRAALRVA
ncbi:MAG: SdpI family protein [Tepidiformaceae bacterium]